MSTPDAVRRPTSDSGARASDRHALIEQLLLAGLDHYFVGQYEQAIHVWTRVFFLDRGHARARAYIERARCALAERQREAEARGAEEIAAVGAASDVVATPALLPRTLSRMSMSGGLPDVRMTAPRRVSRRDLWRGSRDPGTLEPGTLDRGGFDPVGVPGTMSRSPAAAFTSRPGGGRLATHVLLVALAVVLLCSAAYVVVARDRLATWWRTTPVDLSASTPTLNAEPLPLPRASEQTLERARARFARGHLHEALQMLSAIGPDDPLRREADVLLADVERALLEAAGLRVAAPSRSPTTAPLSER